MALPECPACGQLHLVFPAVCTCGARLSRVGDVIEARDVFGDLLTRQGSGSPPPRATDTIDLPEDLRADIVRVAYAVALAAGGTTAECLTVDVRGVGQVRVTLEHRG